MPTRKNPEGDLPSTIERSDKKAQEIYTKTLESAEETYKGDDEAAVGEFKRAIELAPSEPSFHLSLAISLEKTGKVADAQREYAQYLEMDPSAPEAQKLKAHMQALASGQTATQTGSPSPPKAPQGQPD